MKRIKRVSALALALALAASLAVFPASASGEVSTFPDITDPAVGQAVEVLREMGAISGAGGSYFPEGNLTRAEFCKIAVEVMGRGDAVAAYENRTIFVDVASTHWARGYVNLASQTVVDDSRLIMVNNGYFYPDNLINYDEAVTILLRILGYGQKILNNWPADARTMAATLGLNAGIGSFTGGGPITRAQAALLFRNFLLTPTASGSVYAGSALGSAVEDTILLSVSAPAADGSPAVTLSTRMGDPIKPAVNLPAPFMLGMRGTAILSPDGRFLTFLPDSGSRSVTLTVDSVSDTTVTAIDGTKITVPKAATVLRGGSTYTFGEVSPGLNRPGLVLTVCYTSSGSVDYIFVREAGAVSGTPLVAQSDGLGAFSAITNSSSTCKIVKNGSSVMRNALKKWDVGVFDAATDTLYVSDFRLTAPYEAASPNPYAPTKITLFGREFDVLPCAYPSLEEVKVGEVVTALFTSDGKIAALVPSGSASSTALGVLMAGSTSERVRVELINSPIAPLPEDNGRVVLSGTPAYANLSGYEGSVLSVYSGLQRKNGRDVPAVYLSTQESSRVSGDVDIAARTVGGTALSDSAVLFERVGEKGEVTAIAMADINLTSVPAGKVVFTHLNADGKVDILILNDVTGDRYVYGLAKISQKVTEPVTIFGEIINTVTTVSNGSGSFVAVMGSHGTNGGFVGVARSSEVSGHVSESADGSAGDYDVYKCLGTATLTEVKNVTQSSFNLLTRTFIQGELILPIADSVTCYDRRTGRWFDSLEEALVYSNSFTAYYDRTPTSGGKLRVVVVE